MGKYPVTQAQWGAVAMSPKVNLDDLSRNPSFHRGDDNRPVEQVSWHEAREFCDRLTRLAQLKGEKCIYRLPTEAEWEYACRAGSDTEYFFGDDPSQLDGYGWYGNNSGKDAIDADAIWKEVNQDATQYTQKLRENSNMAQVVGQETKTPNAWGLYEMHGNVWEWCLDEWHEDYNSKPDSLKRNGNEAWGDINENDNRYHLLRGGSWNLDANLCRSAYRSRYIADDRDDSFGFRVVVVSFP
jgi:formylglycine-generating enzyme required for sulfatase activity